jgi:hypothetical protein
MFEGKYTTMGSRSTLHPRVVKHQLNSNLHAVMPDVQQEIEESFESQFPACDGQYPLQKFDMSLT